MQKVVMVFGTFDTLHEGHKNFFKQASHFGEVYAIIARDETVEKVKGKKPMQTEKVRLEKVKELKEIKKAALGNKKDKLAKVKLWKPETICLGYDQHFMVDKLRQLIEKNNMATQVITLKPFHPEKYKSSIIRNKFETKL